MAASVRRRQAESFRIHQDAPSTEDTQVNEEEIAEEVDDEDDATQGEDEPDAQDSRDEETPDDETIDMGIDSDLEKLREVSSSFRNGYRLIKRIGEGTFSTVYKAEDLQYDRYDNDWDIDRDNEKWSTPPLKRVGRLKGFSKTGSHQQTEASGQLDRRRRRPKYVAIKKIYVTSSPIRILNELELLHDLQNCPSVCPLITAFRHADQVIAILPYFRHADFREYFRQMSVADTAIYLRSLFTALSSVHAHGIIHRDIKPTNFLYDPTTQHGVLVDFGLAEWEGTETHPCLCHEDPATRKGRLRAALHNSSAPHNGYPKDDSRPSRRANRAGTRGFRAPEVLFKCTEQTSKIDIWSVGVILLTIMSQRFPFFNSADDVEAMIEIATIFGQSRMRAAGQLHGCMFETTIPTVGLGGFSLERIILWSTWRSETGQSLNAEEKLAVEFLGRCLELDPSRRISADEALEHEFLQMGLQGSQESVELGEDDEMDILRV